MSAATAIIEKATREAEGDQCVALYGVGWKGYLTLLRVRGERSDPKMVYLDATVWLMSPAFLHERLKLRLGQFVMEVVVGLAIPCIAAGSTTFRRRARRGGVEGDQTFYLANEERIRGKDRINLRIDPPPDLAIEVVYTHGADEAIEVYRRLRVPELWICDEAELVILVLQANHKYARSTTSAAFPFLTASEIHEWAMRPQTTSDTEWTGEVRRWVRRTLKRRTRRQAGDAVGE